MKNKNRLGEAACALPLLPRATRNVQARPPAVLRCWHHPHFSGSNVSPMCSGLGYLHPLLDAAMWVRRSRLAFPVHGVNCS